MANLAHLTLDGTIHEIKDAVAREHIIYYGTCDTAAATAAKVVTISDGPTELTTGLSIRVKFTNAQTYNGTPTLNLNGLGAKNICRNGTTNAVHYEWLAGEVLDLVYDGTVWIIVDDGVATTTYYGVTKLSSATNSTSTSLAATPSAVKTAYDLADKKLLHSAAMYTKTLAASGWSSGTYTLALTDLVCGGGSVAPIISPVSNVDDYSLIDSAVATAGTGIVFTLASGASVSADITIEIIDFL